MKARLPIRMQIAVLAVAGIVPWFAAGAQGSLQSQLEAKYTLTKPTDDKSDIVTAGSVLVLQKDRILMYSTSTQVPPLNTYSGGRLSEGAYGVHQKMQTFGSMIGHPPPQTIQMRQFVTGEKFWVTKIEVQGDGVIFTLFSDPYQDVRYYSTLKFIYPHGTTPSSDQVLSMVAEVLKVDSDDAAKTDDSGNQQQAAAGADANQPPRRPRLQQLQPHLRRILRPQPLLRRRLRWRLARRRTKSPGSSASRRRSSTWVPSRSMYIKI